ncbi:hypothetical protein LIER_19167 [Lithospermum erythrorhizon]|uniref:SMP domain-containing protein n=1 Tax=Lithospermum erythrorhizon TaxID=34254 RepID=A0AAV3QJB6_LITER
MEQQKKQRRSGPVTYGEIFDVMGELASKAITPRDAAILQSAENIIIGMPQKDGPAAMMRSAARENVELGFVRDQDVTDIVQNEGVTFLEAQAGGCHIVTQVIAGQASNQEIPSSSLGDIFFLLVVGKCSGPVSDSDPPITIGAALEATTLSAGEKPIVKSDAAVIEAAERKATGKDGPILGGIAEEAYAAADQNLETERVEDKIKLRDVLSDAMKKIPNDKPVSREVAEAVIVAEAKNNPNMQTQPGGIVSSIAGAARLNQQK